MKVDGDDTLPLKTVTTDVKTPTTNLKAPLDFKTLVYFKPPPELKTPFDLKTPLDLKTPVDFKTPNKLNLKDSIADLKASIKQRTPVDDDDELIFPLDLDRRTQQDVDTKVVGSRIQ